MYNHIVIQAVTNNTQIVYLDGSPEYVLSTSLNLDAALEAAEQYHGAPLDCGTWGRADDNVDLQDLDIVRPYSSVMAVRVSAQA